MRPWHDRIEEGDVIGLCSVWLKERSRKVEQR